MTNDPTIINTKQSFAQMKLMACFCLRKWGEILEQKYVAQEKYNFIISDKKGTNL